MKKRILLSKGQQYFTVGASILVSFLVVWMLAVGATTISSNVSTDGTLTASGLTTLGFASTTSVSLSQNLMVNGMATTTGSSGNIATEGTLTVAGATTLSSTLSVASGLTTLGFASTTSVSLTQNLMVNKKATTTGSTGNFATEGTITSVGNIGVGTTTPSAEISALGAATTTVYITSSGSGIGGCIELIGTNGTVYKMYVGGGETATTTTSGRVGFTAIWIAGSCK